MVTENYYSIIHQLQIDVNKAQKGDSQDKIDFSTLILKKIPGYSRYLASNYTGNSWYFEYRQKHSL